jgi:glyoxylase-like metal-dependent hydrolase (beta-lactamase superfamily II)
MPLSHPLNVGSLRCHLLEGGSQWLDGGAMFGVVPKPLWSKRVQPDERNRIPLGMRCLLIEHPDGLVLIDTALGDKEEQKFLDIYGVENQGDPGPTRLEDAIRAAGHAPGDVKVVINTHLHFDHAGGNTLRDPGAPAVRLAFPNATYMVQKNELEFARHTNERTRASYLPPNYEPVATAGKWRLIEGDGEILPGISARLTPGHVPWHQSIVLTSGGETAVFLGDVIPTSAHLPLAYIMGYDLEPLRTLESKRALLHEAVKGGWTFIFEHDPAVATGRVIEDTRGKGVMLTEELLVSPR